MLWLEVTTTWGTTLVKLRATGLAAKGAHNNSNDIYSGPQPPRDRRRDPTPSNCPLISLYFGMVCVCPDIFVDTQTWVNLTTFKMSLFLIVHMCAYMSESTLSGQKGVSGSPQQELQAIRKLDNVGADSLASPSGPPVSVPCHRFKVTCVSWPCLTFCVSVGESQSYPLISLQCRSRC